MFEAFFPSIPQVKLSLTFKRVDTQQLSVLRQNSQVIQEPIEGNFQWSRSDTDETVVSRFVKYYKKFYKDILSFHVSTVFNIQEDSDQVAVVFVYNQKIQLRTFQIEGNTNLLSNVTGIYPSNILHGILHQIEMDFVNSIEVKSFYFDPDTLGRYLLYFENLQELTVNNCWLQYVPDSFFLNKLPIKKLDLSQNKISYLPKDIKNLKQLETLILDTNNLTNLPDDLIHCQNLKILELQNNKLNNSSLKFKVCPGIRTLLLHNNPLEYIPDLKDYSKLTQLSVDTVIIKSDQSYQNFEINQLQQEQFWTKLQSSKAKKFIDLVFKRSSIQHPLILGALEHLGQAAKTRKFLINDSKGFQQLVAMMYSDNQDIIRIACGIIERVIRDSHLIDEIVLKSIISGATKLLQEAKEDKSIYAIRVLTEIGLNKDEIPSGLLQPDLLQVIYEKLRSEKVSLKFKFYTLLSMSALAFSESYQIQLATDQDLIQILKILLDDSSIKIMQKECKEYLGHYPQHKEIEQTIGQKPQQNFMSIYQRNKSGHYPSHKEIEDMAGPKTQSGGKTPNVSNQSQLPNPTNKTQPQPQHSINKIQHQQNQIQSQMSLAATLQVQQQQQNQVNLKEHEGSNKQDKSWASFFSLSNLIPNQSQQQLNSKEIQMHTVSKNTPSPHSSNERSLANSQDGSRPTLQLDVRQKQLIEFQKRKKVFMEDQEIKRYLAQTPKGGSENNLVSQGLSQQINQDQVKGQLQGMGQGVAGGKVEVQQSVTQPFVLNGEVNTNGRGANEYQRDHRMISNDDQQQISKSSPGAYQGEQERNITDDSEIDNHKDSGEFSQGQRLEDYVISPQVSVALNKQKIFDQALKQAQKYQLQELDQMRKVHQQENRNQVSNKPKKLNQINEDMDVQTQNQQEQQSNQQAMQQQNSHQQQLNHDVEMQDDYIQTGNDSAEFSNNQESKAEKQDNGVVRCHQDSKMTHGEMRDYIGKKQEEYKKSKLSRSMDETNQSRQKNLQPINSTPAELQQTPYSQQAYQDYTLIEQDLSAKMNNKRPSQLGDEHRKKRIDNYKKLGNLKSDLDMTNAKTIESDEFYKKNFLVQKAAVRLLAGLGHNDWIDEITGVKKVSTQDPNKKRGLRVLSLDGGGMKGLAALKFVKEIEQRTGKKIFELFDVVGGTSTGGMLAVALGIKRYSIDQCEYVYRELGQHIFKQSQNSQAKQAQEKSIQNLQQVASIQEGIIQTQASVMPQEKTPFQQGQQQNSNPSNLNGNPVNNQINISNTQKQQQNTQTWADTFKNMWNPYPLVPYMTFLQQGSIYGDQYEKFLKLFCQMDKDGFVDQSMLSTALVGGPRVFLVSSEATVSPPAPYLLRNYSYPAKSLQRQLKEQLRIPRGTQKLSLWASIRASSAVPFYFPPFHHGKKWLIDGAFASNNPAVLALQEARMLYPDQKVDVLVSIGNGLPKEVVKDKDYTAFNRIFDLSSTVFQNSVSSERVDDALAIMDSLCPDLHIHRLQVFDDRCDIQLDTTDESQLNQILSAFDDFISKNDDQFNIISKQLLD